PTRSCPTRVHPPPPHPFPTRRSSDLPQWRQLCESSEHQPPAKRGERRKGQAIKEAPIGRKTKSRKSAVAAVTGVKEEDIIALDEDRKSTRLNSSHVKISYAVFCLKKK